jgi:hypothetical protein
MDLLAHSGEPPEWVPHGTGRCTCTAEGEDPHCPHHGYEAVIQRLRHELAGAVSVLEWLVAMDEPGNADRPTVTLTEIIDRARGALGGQ